MQLIASYVIALLIFGAVDLTWLSAVGMALYRPILGDILLQSLRLAPAVAFYGLFPIGLVVFAVTPALKADSAVTALLYGILFGALAYATYDLTNYSTLRNWNLQITVIDILYGSIASGCAAALTVVALRHLPSCLGGMTG